MSNKETITWENIPDEVRCIIFKYLPETTLVWLNKTYYDKHHAVIASMIKPSRYQQYVTNMIIRDASFSFNYVMRENIVLWFKKWLIIKNIDLVTKHIVVSCFFNGVFYSIWCGKM